MATHIVTDSTSDLAPSLIEAQGVSGLIHIVPIAVHFGDEEFLSGVNLSTEEFYDRLTRSKVMPRTTQPSPAMFIEHYSAISSPGDTILSFHISSRMSGTWQSAILAARQLGDRRIEVVDTKSASLGVGIVALRAALAVKQGEPPDAVLARCREWIRELKVYFVVDTLEYLHRNGRIGRAQALVGGLLSIKPVLTVDDGVVAPVEKVRGKANARARMLAKAREALAARPEGPPYAAIVHSRAPEEAEELRAAVSADFPNAIVLVGELGPTIGTHVGPGALGTICFPV